MRASDKKLYWNFSENSSEKKGEQSKGYCLHDTTPTLNIIFKILK